MQLVHADTSVRAAVATEAMPWVARGALGEKLLEDDGRGRRTCLVHAPAGARIATAGPGCLDALVLAGALADGPAGTYLHRPAGGELVAVADCTAFVKLRPSHDRSARAIDIRRIAFHPHHTPGLFAAELHEDAHGRVVLLRFTPGTAIGPHVHRFGEEFFVLEGAVTDELGTYAPQTWVRQPPRSVHSIASAHGCLFLTFADHL
ncbi:MAG: cupin domain-containing protein [Deltaproteobacteria bacterium]|nr:cupin domain-containing protein [Deltaproteobacteria bacterium]